MHNFIFFQHDQTEAIDRIIIMIYVGAKEFSIARGRQRYMRLCHVKNGAIQAIAYFGSRRVFF